MYAIRHKHINGLGKVRYMYYCDSDYEGTIWSYDKTSPDVKKFKTKEEAQDYINHYSMRFHNCDVVEISSS